MGRRLARKVSKTFAGLFTLEACKRVRLATCQGATDVVNLLSLSAKNGRPIKTVSLLHALAPIVCDILIAVFGITGALSRKQWNAITIVTCDCRRRARLARKLSETLAVSATNVDF